MDTNTENTADILVDLDELIAVTKTLATQLSRTTRDLQKLRSRTERVAKTGHDERAELLRRAEAAEAALREQKELAAQLATRVEQADRIEQGADEDEMLKVAEAAALLGVTRQHVYNLIERGLPAVRFGGITRIRRTDLKAFAASHLVGRKAA